MMTASGIRAWLVTVAISFVAATQVVTAPDDCPGQCLCQEAPEGYEYICGLPRTNVTLQYAPFDYINIVCDLKTIYPYESSQLPRLPKLRNDTFGVVGLKYCPLPNEPLIRGLQALGVRSARTLVVEYVPDGTAKTLRRQHLQGLSELLELELQGNANEPLTLFSDLLETSSEATKLQQLKLHFISLDFKADRIKETPPLKILQFYSCNITKIPDYSFQGLSSLQRLTFWDSPLKNVTNATFAGLALEKLELSVTKLRVIPKEMFTTMSNLKLLRLVGNNLEELSLGSVPMLENVIVKNNRAPLQLTEDALKDATALRELNVTQSRLQSLPAGVLDNQEKLQILDLSWNEIKELNDTLFRSLRQLKHLNLRKNLIEELPADVFSGLSTVVSIDLSDNRLVSVSRSTFHDTRAMTWLSLARNRLTLARVPTGIVEYDTQSPLVTLTELQHLDLSGNQITTLFSDWQMVHLKLKTLDLSYNNITWLYGYSGFLQQEIEINLQYNKMTRIEPPHLLQTDDGTRITLLLENNPLQCDCGLFELIDMLHNTSGTLLVDFQGAICQSPFKLSGQPLQDVQPIDVTCSCQDFPHECGGCQSRPAAQMMELDCYGQPTLQEYNNVLKDSEYNVSLRLRNKTDSLLTLSPKVRHLSLAGLNLPELPALPLSQLDSLDISYNKLAMVPVSLFNSDLKLYLRGNLLRCTCLQKAELSALNNYRYNVMDYANITCDDKGPLENVDVARLCDFWYAVGAGSGLVALGVLIVLATLTLYCCGVSLQVILDYMGLLPPDYDEDKIYDAFFSFAHQDHFFVVDEILPGLADYKLCLHYRDWIGGGWIPSQIYNSVKVSRRTILFISKHFVKSRWSVMEFRTAYELSQKEGRRRIIAILVDDVMNDINLDADLRAYLKMNTYIEWGDPWFWQKLSCALPRRPGRRRARARGGMKMAEVKTNGDKLDIWVTSGSKPGEPNASNINSKQAHSVHLVK